MIKKYSFILCVSALCLAAATEHADAQISGSGAYIKGNYIELGIDSIGGYEGADMSTAIVPSGMHPRPGGTGIFGFVANPQMNAWATYDGDFLSESLPENGWGFEIGTTGGDWGSNNTMWRQHMMSGHIASYYYSPPYYSIDWEGSTSSGDLDFKINYLLNENALFYTTTVWVRNNGTDTIPQMYFYKNINPANNASVSGEPYTTNRIIDQAPAFGGSSVATVTAAQYAPWVSTLVLMGDNTFKAGYGGEINRDGSNMFDGIGYTQAVGASTSMDTAIYLACAIENLAPADSSMHDHFRSAAAGNERSFRYLTAFDSATIFCARHTFDVNLPPYPDVTVSDPSFVLTGGSPAGGTYYGPGVSGGMFNPAVTGPGDFDIIYSYTDGTGCTGAAVSTMHVNDVSAGIGNNTVTPVVSLYPNPFSDEAILSVGKNVQLQNATLHVYDVLGKEIRTIAGISTNEIRIDRKEMPAGMYFYRLINKGNNVATGRMIVK